MATTNSPGPRTASVAICLVSVVTLALPAHAQNPPQGTQGPIVIERLQSGWAIAPDVKVTRFDGGTHVLAGAYGGWVIDNRLLIGAEANWLTDPRRGRELSYGGGVVQWRRGTDRTVGFSVKGLVGWGSARATGDVSVVHFERDAATRQLTPVRTTERLALREDFFVAEPDADVLVRLSSHIRLHAGGGYRAVAGAHRLNDEIRGATGTVAVEFGPSSRR